MRLQHSLNETYLNYFLHLSVWYNCGVLFGMKIVLVFLD